MNDIEYLPNDFLEEDNEISQDFQWEHTLVEDGKAIILYATNSQGEETKIIFDRSTMEDFMVGAMDFLEYLRGTEQ